MMSEEAIKLLLKRIGDEIGIVLSRQSDHDRIMRYLDNGGTIPLQHEPLPPDLIHLVTTNETYFERESHHFDYLLTTILPEIDKLPSSKPIRILCAPCSSGEEPYSIAIRLSESSKRFSRPIEIIGVDISQDMINKALLGYYSSRSVHSLSPEVLSKYFSHEDDYYRILPPQSIKVHFRSGNLFSTALWHDLGTFDVIFSRNMMIYFDKQKNKELLTLFKKHLNGYLIIGHADDHIQAREVFTSIRTDKGNIYRL